MTFLTNGKTDTSAAAGASILPHVGRLEGMVYAAIVEGGAIGACCFEIEERLGLSHQTTSARITGLKYKRLINDSTLRRLTPSKREAIAWVPRKRAASPRMAPLEAVGMAETLS